MSSPAPGRRTLRSVEEATAAVTAALRDVASDNPVQAVRRIAAVARRCELPGESSWEAFRWNAEKAVRPYFERRKLPAAKAATWAVLDPYFGQLSTRELPEAPSPRTRRRRGPGTVVVAGGAR